ncbi:MAG TPA: hypothetical protein VMW52_12710 [Phycisphaerae bacterium]|nr:hypothetical protein [Phycisphaerae bacterium]
MDPIQSAVELLLSIELAAGNVSARELVALLRDGALVQRICEKAREIIGPPPPPPNRTFMEGWFGAVKYETKESKRLTREWEALMREWERRLKGCRLLPHERALLPESPTAGDT